MNHRPAIQDDAVRETVARFLDRKPDTISTRDKLCDHLGLDSIAKLELLATVEERHGVLLRDDQITGITTVEDLLEAMKRTRKGALS